MRNYRINIYDLWLYFIIALATGIFLVLPIKLDNWRHFLCISAVIFSYIYMMTHKSKKHTDDKFLLLYLALLVAIIIFQIIRAINLYGYSIYETYYALRQYIWIIMTIPLCVMFKKKDKFEKMFITIINITFFSLLLRTLTWIAYSIFNVTLFENILYEYGVSWGRNGSMRIDATPLIGIVIVGLAYFYLNTNKIKYLLKLIAVLFYLYIVTQTRMLIIGSISCLLIMFYFKKRKSTIRFLIRFTVIIAIAVAISLGAFDGILSYLNLSSGTKGLEYRYYEFEYFLGLLENGKWKLGLGILTSVNSASNILLFGNLTTQMYLDDLGFLECFAQFGIFSFVMYGMLYIYMFCAMRKCFKNHLDGYGLLILGLLSYVFIISIPLNLFGIQRSFSIPFILGITEYVASVSKDIA